MGYHVSMRRTASIRIIVLSFMLAAGNLMLAGHVALHLKANASTCEWCVCQGQTFAAPLPSSEPVILVRQARPLHLRTEITLLPEPAPYGYQSRAPPSFV